MLLVGNADVVVVFFCDLFDSIIVMILVGVILVRMPLQYCLRVVS